MEGLNIKWIYAGVLALAFTTCNNNMKYSAPEVPRTFSTQGQEIARSPCNDSATVETQALYRLLLDNYGKKTLAAAMANVNWNYEVATRIYQWTAEYPAINCFDFMHLYASPSDWINYDDITPVKEWHDRGGIVAAMWHWNVPATDPYSGNADDIPYAFYAENTGFDPENVRIVGTWENQVFYNDLHTVATHLKALQEAGIPVIWRPFHEAAGRWFWWGKADGATYIQLWRAMFETFKEAGVNNLIWVWTAEKDDEDWYPGDAYVDMIGRDLYGKTDLTELVSEFSNLCHRFPAKMVALSECGRVSDIADQWDRGAQWSWFMPWYGTADETTGELHAGESWWQAAMNSGHILKRSDLK